MDLPFRRKPPQPGSERQPGYEPGQGQPPPVHPPAPAPQLRGPRPYPPPQQRQPAPAPPQGRRDQPPYDQQPPYDPQAPYDQEAPYGQQPYDQWSYGSAPVPPAAAPPPRERGGLRERWRPLTPDNLPVADFEPAPPTGLSYRPDTVCDGWSTPDLHLRLASVRGYLHRYNGRPREDDVAAAFEPGSGAVVFAVADGVSSARQPHVGAQVACRSAVDELLAQIRAGGPLRIDWERLLTTVHWQLIEQARRILRDPDAGVTATAELLGTTLVAGIATPTADGVEIAVVSVGDSGVWQIKDDRVRRLAGGKDAQDGGLVSSAVDPLPRLPPGLRAQTFYLDPGTVVLIGTDGFGDPVGDIPQPGGAASSAGGSGRPDGEIPPLFVRELRTPIPPLGFAHLLDFSRETFDDDRTLLALWPRTGAGRTGGNRPGAQPGTRPGPGPGPGGAAGGGPSATGWSR
ncbi:protein phosphatase 2C domain-containing protein [Streptomyces sp. NBC_01477]|uniref:protein phosphatase 2C domain-containing protein n=1 Tax=Streptomyces sp. NBC_01477 TaxID=2976015 RepID=UPI002E3411FA|nr:protein phosphatase 2C domain-containing protein [Streptomyces sp. NBC_01477]